MAKNVCAIGRAEFLEKAQPVHLTINGQTVDAAVREFSTGSFGWFYSGKVQIEIGGKPVQVQVGMNMAVIGSKNLPKDA